MTSYLDSLNLRPFEKRLVVGVAVVLFVVLNAWFVVPHFSDVAEAKKRRADALLKMKRWQKEIDQKGKYERGISNFIKEGQEVQAEDQVNQFARTIQEQQVRSGTGVGNLGRTSTSTNQFFLELTAPVSVQCGEGQLVDFLYNLGSGNSLIRVRDLSLRPDPPRQQLNGSVKLVASYQKTSTKKATPAASPAAAGAKTVTTTAKRP